MPSWSVVLIAKDEEQSLPHLIESLQGFRDRSGNIVLVDTGSTDETIEVARSYGCRVEAVGDRFVTHMTDAAAENINERFVAEGEQSLVSGGDRIFNYGDARNFAASLASNDMVSMPDCDEEYANLDLDAIERYIKDGFEQLEFQFVYAHDPYGNEAVKFRQCKFYDRRKLRWKGVIHEVLQGHAKSAELPEAVLKLVHHQNQNQDRSHYLRGLALACYKEPKDDRNLHYLGRELCWTGRPKSAIAVLERHVAMKRWPAERAQSMIFMGDCFGQIGKPDEQVEWYHRAYGVDPTRRESLIRLARFYQKKNIPTATAVYAAAALQVPWHAYYANQVAHYKQEPHELLYWAKGWMGDVPAAREHILKALEYQPHNPRYLRDTKYYFEYADQGIPGYMLFNELQWLFNTAKEMDSIAEVGSWKGRSTHALACGCRLGHVTAIDHFKGSGEGDWTHGADEDAVFQEFSKNTANLTNLSVVRSTSQEAADQFEDESFDMVFIDAGHTYEEAKADIRAWRSKAKIMLCGHDYCDAWPGVKQAVDEEIGAVNVEGSIWYKLLREPKVHVVLPTLGRPDKLNRCLRAIKENAGYRNYEVSVLPDQPPPGNIGVPKLLKQFTDNHSSDELIVYLGNDCVPQPGFLRQAVYAMLRHFPRLPGLIGLNDGYWHGEVATHWMAGGALLYMLDGELFHTGYHHTGCDNELTERCRKMGKYHWEERAVVLHDHPTGSGNSPEQADEVYKLGWQHREEDIALLKKRSEELGFEYKESYRRPIIPRRLFTIWIGGPPPDWIEGCIVSQRIPGFEHHRISLANCYRNEFIQKCIDQKQWVVAADYLRLYYLHEYGGIYLDADVEVLKPFPNDMLGDKLFCCREENQFVSNAVAGAIKGHPLLKRCMDKMENTGLEPFVNGMEIFTNEVYKAQQRLDEGIRIYEPEVCFPYNHQTGETNITDNTVVFHHFMKSWKQQEAACA